MVSPIMQSKQSVINPKSRPDGEEVSGAEEESLICWSLKGELWRTEAFRRGDGVFVYELQGITVKFLFQITGSRGNTGGYCQLTEI